MDTTIPSQIEKTCTTCGVAIKVTPRTKILLCDVHRKERSKELTKANRDNKHKQEGRIAVKCNDGKIRYNKPVCQDCGKDLDRKGLICSSCYKTRKDKQTITKDVIRNTNSEIFNTNDRSNLINMLVDSASATKLRTWAKQLTTNKILGEKREFDKAKLSLIYKRINDIPLDELRNTIRNELVNGDYNIGADEDNKDNLDISNITKEPDDEDSKDEDEINDVEDNKGPDDEDENEESSEDEDSEPEDDEGILDDQDEDEIKHSLVEDTLTSQLSKTSISTKPKKVSFKKDIPKIGSSK